MSHPSIGREEKQMTTETIETFHADGVWRNRVVGGDTYPETFDDKSGAAELGSSIARDARIEHVVRDEDGQVVERHSYADAPPHDDQW
jgi:hypothetical protein